MQIRCKNCGFWNTTESYESNCTSCGEALRKIEQAELDSIERRKTTGEPKIPIYPNDSILSKIGKHIYNIVTLVFIGIISFFLWLFAAGPG